MALFDKLFGKRQDNADASDHNRWDGLLAKLDLPEARYKADLDLFDRSQAFSSELLKLALVTANDQHQRPEPAAAEQWTRAELNGWLRSGECCG